tara:strand:- start:53866 stop:54060 length:195 start_codon:yes stop_codon:yes gene_type:complete
MYSNITHTGEGIKMSEKGVYRGYCLVRDKNGEPKFDSIVNIPQPYWDMLTEEEKLKIINKRKEA